MKINAITYRSLKTTFLLSVLLFPVFSRASHTDFFEGEWYVSWGYNRDYWANSDIHVTQPALGNNFTVHNVEASDFPQWNEGGLIFDKDPTEPQYNVRIGRFVDDARSIALEFNYDHTKYNTNIGQYAHVSGTINNAGIDSNQQLTSTYFRYNLHNGANHFMINVVKRVELLRETNQTLSLAGIGRIGVGAMFPHSENTILGNDNQVGEKKWGNYVGTTSGWWQLNGWTTGVEIGFRFVVYNPVYLELTDKEAFAILYDVPVYEGTASQKLWMNEVILSVGCTLNGSYD